MSLWMAICLGLMLWMAIAIAVAGVLCLLFAGGEKEVSDDVV